jgi:hypothetical protein
MLDNAVTKLNFTIKLDSLKEYYHTLTTNYDNLCWKWDRHKHEITEEWYN